MKPVRNGCSNRNTRIISLPIFPFLTAYGNRSHLSSLSGSAFWNGVRLLLHSYFFASPPQSKADGRSNISGRRVQSKRGRRRWSIKIEKNGTELWASEKGLERETGMQIEGRCEMQCWNWHSLTFTQTDTEDTQSLRRSVRAWRNFLSGQKLIIRKGLRRSHALAMSIFVAKGRSSFSPLSIFEKGERHDDEN